MDELRDLLLDLEIDLKDSLSQIHPNSIQALSQPTDIFRSHLAHVIGAFLQRDASSVLDSIQIPNTLQNGDLVIPVPRLRLKGRKADELARQMAAAFPNPDALFLKPEATGIHVPFFFSPAALSHLILPCILQRQASYGCHDDKGRLNVSNPEENAKETPKRKKVVVEFSSPNIAKEFHAGHLRSTIIGAFIANLYLSMGWDVVKVNYLGDWGKQFGLLAVGWKRFGSEEALAREPLKHLLSVYAQINALFKPEQDASRDARDKGLDPAEIESRGLYAERNAFFRLMETGDPEALALWRRFRDLSIERYISTYARLNIDFDEYSGESQVQSSYVEFVESQLRDKGVYAEREGGSWAIDFEKHGRKGLGVAIVRGRTGTTTYLLRDVAAILQREEQYHFDKMIYVVSCEQDMYFKRVFATLELMGRGDLAARLQHVSFGKVMGMSSRLGNVRLLSDILDQTQDAMHEVMQRNEVKYAQVADPKAVAEAVGMAAVMVQDMSGKRVHNYPFDMGRMTSFEGDTGPYLQYCHARLRSVLRKAGVTREELLDHLTKSTVALDAGDIDKPQCVDLLRLMAQYPDVTANALQNLEPSTILTYLFRLAHQLSSCYDVLQAVGAKEGREAMLGRASLFEAARQVLENAMKLLGLSPVERYVLCPKVSKLAPAIDVTVLAKNES